MILIGKIWKFGDNISTELMLPNYVLYNKKDIHGKECMQFIFNTIRPNWYKKVKKGDIIIAGKNFGCGSSRPAPRLLKSLGISCIIVESISRLFYRNSIHIGLPIVVCPDICENFVEGESAEVNILTGEIKNINKCIRIKGEALHKNSPPYDILQAGGIEPYLKMILSKKNHPEKIN